MIYSLFQITVFVMYITFVMRTQGTAPSISESWDLLEEKEKPLFALFCWGIGLPMFFMSTQQSHFFFLSGLGLVLVGAASFLQRSFGGCIHRAGASAGIIGALLGLWLDYGSWWPILALGLVTSAVAIWNKIENKIWWIEVSAFTIISIGLLWR
jgi:hypothetical protein